NLHSNNSSSYQSYAQNFTPKVLGQLHFPNWNLPCTPQRAPAHFRGGSPLWQESSKAVPNQAFNALKCPHWRPWNELRRQDKAMGPIREHWRSTVLLDSFDSGAIAR